MEYQKILEDDCNKAGMQVSGSYLENIDEKNLKVLQDNGMIFVPESNIDMKALKAAGEKAYEKLNLTAARDRIHKDI